MHVMASTLRTISWCVFVFTLLVHVHPSVF
jgi:hypothetical protein